VKHPILNQNLIQKPAKIENFLQRIFPEWFGPKQIEAISFRNGFHDKSAQTDCSKEMWIPILKRLKHLNLDLLSFLLLSQFEFLSCHNFIFNRPGVAGAVLSTASSLIH
jgi:hypothetical protein